MTTSIHQTHRLPTHTRWHDLLAKNQWIVVAFQAHLAARIQILTDSYAACQTLPEFLAVQTAIKTLQELDHEAMAVLQDRSAA
jgi:hypothetical protein